MDNAIGMIQQIDGEIAALGEQIKQLEKDRGAWLNVLVNQVRVATIVLTNHGRSIEEKR